MIRAAAGLLLILCGQQGGGFGQGSRIDWYTDLTPFITRDPRPRFAMKKYIFVYVKAPGDVKEPADFGNNDISAASQGLWAFVWMDRDPENSWQKTWGVRTVPTCVGCDIRGNAFHIATSTGANQIRTLLRSVPEAIARFEAKLKADYAKAIETLKSDEAKGIKALVDFVLQGHAGFKEVDDALAALKDSGDKSLKNSEMAESVSAQGGIDYLEGLVKLYESTPPGALAEIRIAKLEHARGNSRAAIQRLQKIQKYDPKFLKNEIAAAGKLLAEITSAAAGTPAAAKSPEPAAAAQSEALKQIRDLHKAEYAKRSAEDIRALAKNLLELGLGSADDPAARFVLFREARDLAAQAGDAALAMESIDAAAKWFAVDALTLKTAALARAGAAARTPPAARAMAEAYLALMNEAVETDHFDVASGVTSKAEAAARAAQDASLLAQVQAFAREATHIQKEYGAAKAQIAVLTDKPDDPAANLAAGAFYAFAKGEWDKGLPLLAKGADEALKTLAVRDLKNFADPADQVALADSWWNLAEKETNAGRKARMRDRARHWYESALPKLAGLTKAVVEKRVSEIVALPSRGPNTPVDLLKWIDPKLDAVDAASWQLQGNVLSVDSRDNFARLQVPCIPPAEYDLTIVATRKSRNDQLNVGLAVGENQFIVSIDNNDGTLTTVGLIDGNWGRPVGPPDATSQLSFRGSVFVNDAPGTIVCSVRKARLHVTVDGKTVVDWKPDYSRCSVMPRMAVPNPRVLFLGAATHYEISRFTLMPVSGPARRAR